MKHFNINDNVSNNNNNDVNNNTNDDDDDDDDDTYDGEIRDKISDIRSIISRLGNIVPKNDRDKIIKELYEIEKKKKTLSDE